jgi:superfamily I DNA and/or RNA helicase
MHPLIGGLIAECFYPEGLEHGVSAEDRPYGLELLGSPLRWLDTARSPRRAEAKVGTSYVNYYEAAAIVKQLKRLARRLPVGARLTVGILTGYGPQAEHLVRRIEKDRTESWSGLELQVLTVDAAQGKEFDLVFYSGVRSNADHKIGFLRDRRRLNVALSRARHGLTIVGDSNSLGEARVATGYNPFSGILAYIRRLPERCSIIQLEDDNA